MSRTASRSVTVAAGAAGVLAVTAAIAIGSLIHLPMPPDQLPGYARRIGLNPATDVLRLGILILLPLLTGIAVARLSAGRPTVAWRTSSRPVFLGLSVFLIAASTLAGYGVVVAVPIGIIFAVATVLFRRKLAVLVAPDRLGLPCVVATSLLVWSFLAEPLVSIGLTPRRTGLLLLLLMLGEAFLIGRGDLECGASNLAVSSLGVPIALVGSRPRAMSWLIGIAIVLLPGISALWRKKSWRTRRALRGIAKFVLLPGAMVAFSATVFLRVPPIADVFEDGHGLLPASEYLRGEKPYRDIVPGHGFLADGGIQAVALRVFGDDYVGLRRGMKVAGASFWPTIYFLGFAATGSAAFGLWIVLLTFLWFPQYTFVRVVASLAVLALATAAARTGRRGLWVAAGVGLPVAILLSVDFAVYAATACLVAIVVSRHGPRFALRRFLIGCLLGAAAVGIPFAAAGTLLPFLSTTFLDLGRLMPVYALGFHVGFTEIGQWLAGWSFLRNRESSFGCSIVLAAFVVALIAARFPRLGARGRALAPVLAWFFAAVMSLIERHHVGYAAFVLPLMIVLLARWIARYLGWHSARSLLIAVLAGALLICVNPPEIASFVATWIRTPRVPPDLTELAMPTRARGTLFPRAQRTLVLRTHEFLRSRSFVGSDTWLDFSNSPGLYYLFDRDCPIRYYEVPFYESEPAQNEVIAAVRTNRHVRAVLVRSGLWNDAIDGMSNFERAPRVGEFIRREFHPAYSRDGVEFWERNARSDSGGP